MGWGDKTGPKIKKRKSANEYTQVFSVAVTTRRLIASSHKTAYLMNNTQTHTVESTQHSVSPQAIVICAGFQASKAHQCTTRCTEDQKKKKKKKWHVSICAHASVCLWCKLSKKVCRDKETRPGLLTKSVRTAVRRRCQLERAE